MRLSSVLVVILALAALPPVRAAAQRADASSVDAAILDVLLARGLIDQGQYDELLELARANASESRGEIDLIEGRLARLRAPDLQTSGGTPGKLLFKSSDGKWSMAVKGRIQARVENVDSTDDTKEAANISVPRARLGLEGTSGAENVKYRLEFDLNTNKKLEDPAKEGTLTTRQAWIDWGFENGMAVLLGQTEFPFGREAMTSSGAQELGERSILFTEFMPEYEPQVQLHGTANDGEFEYQVAVSNGEGRGKNNTPGSTKNGLRKGVRVVWNPLGAFKADGPAFQTVDTGETRLALGASYMTNEDSSGLNTNTVGVDTRSLGYEVQVLSGPWAIAAESITRDEQDSVDVNDDDKGNLFQVGYLITPTWEVVGRRAAIDFDNKDDMIETGLGLNFYVDRHNGKWQLEWNRVDAQGVSADTSLWRLGYQLMF